MALSTSSLVWMMRYHLFNFLQLHSSTPAKPLSNMQRLRLFHVLLCLFLALSSVSLAALTPQKHLSLAALKEISKQTWQQKVPNVRGTTATTPELRSQPLIKYISAHGLDGLTTDRKTPTNRLKTTIDTISARAPQLKVSSRQSGLNFDSCTADSDCTGARLCKAFVGDDILPCTSGQNCGCLGTDASDLLCTSDSDCDAGESCVTVDANQVCVSDNVIESSPPEDNPGLTFDSCSDSSECSGTRVCRGSEGLFDSDPDLVPCTPNADCNCFATDTSDLFCTSDSDCDDGENCREIESENLCASETANEFIERVESAVCIGSDSLTHFASEELVFKKHVLAPVLCDMNESCATPGHMVVYKGEALMMKSYCKLAGCTRRVKRVNSPKYIQKLTIPSKTQDLMFTAFAARFETVAEEGALSVAVRLGF